ncbi:hypothetical protein [Serratia liquefaciens]|uniref:hypothetical protein n=1 Tax=Serratia liquefaciens TaxID=614 RepID=UPI001C2C6712|nr:hypothetical protein [Serratia liquefaciens]MBV0841536.1 hypothetical protein [Serratia liquefaciens]
MKSIEQIRAEANELVAGLFAGGKTPVEQFGLSWEKLERLERHCPEVVIKAELQGVRRLACG